LFFGFLGALNKAHDKKECNDLGFDGFGDGVLAREIYLEALTEPL
jgi:hypothetical protein